MSIHVPASGGTTASFNGDVYTTELAAASTGGAIGMVRASVRPCVVPPGGGPAPHVHDHTDETFYVLDGDLEFLDGTRTFTAGAGDAVFVPRHTTHRFTNPGHPAGHLAVPDPPWGPEGLFVEGGDEPRPGVQVAPWGPERIDERLLGLLAQYDTGLPPAPG